MLCFSDVRSCIVILHLTEIHQRDFTPVIFLGLCAIFARKHNRLSDPDMKQEHQKNHQKTKAHSLHSPFHTAAYIPPSTEPILKHNEPIIVYLLLSSAADKPVVATHTHTGQRTMHTVSGCR